jgi:cytochrome c2
MLAFAIPRRSSTMNGKALLAILAIITAGASLQAKLPWTKKAQSMGFDQVKNCQSCHATEKPKKGDALAPMGQYLMDRKEKEKAAEVDLAWLKDYKGK